MNKEMLKSYEADYQFFCEMAADTYIELDSYKMPYLRSIFTGVIEAYKLAANQMMSRLELLSPSSYPYSGQVNRSFNIQMFINLILERRKIDVKKTQPLS